MSGRFYARNVDSSWFGVSGGDGEALADAVDAMPMNGAKVSIDSPMLIANRSIALKTRALIEGLGSGEHHDQAGTVIFAGPSLGATDYILKLPLYQNDDPSAGLIFLPVIRDFLLYGNGTNRGLLLNSTGGRAERISVRNCGDYAIVMAPFSGAGIESLDGGGLFGCRVYGSACLIQATNANIEASYFNGAGGAGGLVVDGSIVSPASSASGIRIHGQNIFESQKRPVIEIAPTYSVGATTIDGGTFSNSYAAASGVDALIRNTQGAKGIGPLAITNNRFHASHDVPAYLIDLIYAGGITITGNSNTDGAPIRINVGAYNAGESCDIRNNGNTPVEVKFNRSGTSITGFTEIHIDQNADRHFATFKGKKVETTDATPVKVFRFPMEANSGGYFRAIVAMVHHANPMEVNIYEKHARASCLTVAGGATVVQTPVVNAGDNPAYTCGWAATNEYVEFSVTGAAATTLEWIIEIEYDYRGAA